MTRGRCSSGKIVFLTYDQAASYCRSAPRKRGNLDPVRPYRCSECREWHIASIHTAPKFHPMKGRRKWTFSPELIER